MNGLHPCTLSQRAPFAAVSRVSPLCAAFCPDSECVCGAAEKAHVAPTCGQRGKTQVRNPEKPRRSGGFSALGCRIAPAFFTLPARWRNVGFSCRAAHALAVGAESRTQRRHAAHGAVQAVCPPTGSIGTIISTVGRSAPSTLFRQISRSPLLFRKDTKIPFFLRVSTLFRI